MILEKVLNDFWNWFEMTPKEYSESSNNGELETEFSDWTSIYDAAKAAIEKLNDEYDEELAELLIQSLAIDNECENILELIKANLSSISQFSEQVIQSKQVHARWQWAELLGHRDPNESSNILVQLINKDQDIYVQRRALLSLMSIDMKKAKIECEKFINSTDIIFKRIALEIKFKH
jgi:HEAT repeat protein